MARGLNGWVVCTVQGSADILCLCGCWLGEGGRRGCFDGEAQNKMALVAL